MQIESLQASLKMQESILQSTSDLSQMHYSKYMACEQDQRQALQTISVLESKLSKAETQLQKLTTDINVVNQAHAVSKKENMQALQQISALESKITTAEKTYRNMSSKLESEREKSHEILNQNQNEITCKIKAFDRERQEKDNLQAKLFEII